MAKEWKELLRLKGAKVDGTCVIMAASCLLGAWVSLVRHLCSRDYSGQCDPLAVLHGITKWLFQDLWQKRFLIIAKDISVLGYCKTIQAVRQRWWSGVACHETGDVQGYRMPAQLNRRGNKR